jgi:DNA helicase HerA-like ATPase
MKEGRKYGVAVVAASQGLADFHDDVVGNAGTKISFRINNPDSRKVSRFFTARNGQNLTETLEQLVPKQALVQTPEMPYATRVHMRNVEG